MPVTKRAPGEVRRILARLTVERMIAGWSVQALSTETGVHRSVIDRWESGEVMNPMASILATLATPLGLRLDFVAERHLPLLNLDEFEIAALIEAAWAYQCGEPLKSGSSDAAHLRSALKKLGKISVDVNHV